ncbi:hypothetical protein [Desulfovibrio porci]|nr:hypothetical protein [Desulfovibrio porci]MDY3809350.1 hypothetical protein [Desulfovibrio porci]
MDLEEKLVQQVLFEQSNNTQQKILPIAEPVASAHLEATRSSA